MALSSLLVVAQMVLIALIISPSSGLFHLSLFGLFGIALILFAGLLAVWALISMKRGTFTVLPEPTKNNTLTTNGPYAYIRHPMYSAVLIACLGAAIGHASGSDLLLLAVLGGVLFFKIQREEILLSKRHEDYARYKSETKALIPFLI